MNNITTKKGDRGTTNIFNKTNISKDNPLIHLIGQSDEVQSVLGVLKQYLDAKEKKMITKQQKQIYIIMGELSGANIISKKQIQTWTAEIELKSDKLLSKKQISNQFVVPGRTSAEAWCHFARTHVRRLERRFVSYAKKQKTLIKFLPYLNRLSDYLFILGCTKI